MSVEAQGASPHVLAATKGAYEYGFQDGVLTTLVELAQAHTLTPEIASWCAAVRAKVEADRLGASR